ncbi:MAG: hypothetical protein ACREMY_24805 [bacterium]
MDCVSISMMNPTNTALTALNELRTELLTRARDELTETNPRYVDEVQRLFEATGDLEHAKENSQAFLGDGYRSGRHYLPHSSTSS